MQHAQDLSGITSYTYDANGNQLTIEEPSGDITTNVWDGENRLVEVHHSSGDIVTYAYNGDGLRVWQDDGVDEVRYVHDGNNVLLETDGVGTVEAEFTYIPQAYAQVISQLRSGDSSFYQFDGTSNVRQLTDSSQVVTDDYSFDAWGDLISSTGSTGNSQFWKGQYLAYRKDPDASPEVQYAMHHRNYNPKTGVFTSADPAKDDLNLYRYVKNNPVNRTDPSGLEEKKIVWGPRVKLYTGSWSVTEDVWLAATGAGGDSYSENAKSAHQALRVVEKVPGVGFVATGTRKTLEGIQGRELTAQIESGESQIDQTIDQSPELRQALPVVEQALPLLPLLAGKPDAEAAKNLVKQVAERALTEASMQYADEEDEAIQQIEQKLDSPDTSTDKKRELLTEWLDRKLRVFALRNAVRIHGDEKRGINTAIDELDALATAFDRRVQELEVAEGGGEKALRQTANQLNQAAAAGKQNQDAIWGILSAIEVTKALGEGIANAQAGEGKSDAPAEKLEEVPPPNPQQAPNQQNPEVAAAAAAPILVFGMGDDDEEEEGKNVAPDTPTVPKATAEELSQLEKSGGRVTRQAVTAERAGVQLGREHLLEKGHNGVTFTEPKPGYANTLEPHGVDDVLHGSDGNIYLVEYKGGTGKLSPGQMEPAWVTQKIKELNAQGNPWGKMFEDARRNGKLRGVSVETPYAPGKGAGETRLAKEWDYKQ